MPAAAIAIPAAISAGTSIFGGVLGSRAAKKSADIQSQAAQEQAQGFQTALGQYNPQIGAAAERGGQMAMDAAGQVRQDALGANELLRPYSQLGSETAQSLRDFMAPGGAGMQTFTAADMEAYDPGYQFRLDEAKQALEKSAAARGGLLGGGTAKALARQQQNLASSEFGAAHERFRQQQQDRFSRLFGTTQLGGQYAGQAGQNLMAAGAAGQRAAEFGGELGFRGAGAQASNALDTQRMISDLMTGGAAARAAGTVGSANAWGGALGGVGNAAMWAGSQYQANREGEADRQVMSQWMNPALQPQLPAGYDPGTYRPPDWNLPPRGY